jgi:hypothetical protein
MYGANWKLVEILGVLMKGVYPFWQSVLWDKNLAWVDVRDFKSDN